MQSKLLILVSKELTRMLTRSLDNAPSADEIHFFAATMADDLYNLGYGENYLDRIEDAFNFFGRHAERWPTTRDIMETIKSRRYIFVAQQKQIENKKEWKPMTKGKHTPAYLLAEKIKNEIVVKKRERKPIATINDVDYERLSKEDSIEGKIFRHVMRAD